MSARNRLAIQVEIADVCDGGLRDAQARGKVGLEGPIVPVHAAKHRFEVGGLRGHERCSNIRRQRREDGNRLEHPREQQHHERRPQIVENGADQEERLWRQPVEPSGSLPSVGHGRSI